MSGSSINLESIRKGHPHEAESLKRLEALLTKTAASEACYRWTLDRLCDLVQPQSKEELALILGELVSRGILTYEIQVESPKTHTVIARFTDFHAIPDEIADSSTGLRVPVTEEDLRLVYATRAG